MGIFCIGIATGYSKNHIKEERLVLEDFCRAGDLAAVMIGICADQPDCGGESRQKNIFTGCYFETFAKKPGAVVKQWFPAFPAFHDLCRAAEAPALGGLITPASNLNAAKPDTDFAGFC